MSKIGHVLSSVQIVDERGRLLADGSSMCFIRLPGGEAAVTPAAEPASDPAPSPGPLGLVPPQGSLDPYERPEPGEVHPQEVWGRMSGLEVLEAQIAGDLPKSPISFLVGSRLVECGPGRAVFALPCHEWLCSPLRTVQGGTIAMIADAARAAAIQTTAPAGAALAAIDLKVNFVRPVKPDGRELLAHGRVLHAGRTIAIAEAEVVNADGKLVALATGSAMVLAGRQATLSDSD